MEKTQEEVLHRHPFWQPKEGYRYSLDALLVAGFVSPSSKSLKVLDIGTGSGIITLLLSKRFPQHEYAAVEIQQDLHDLAALNFDLHQLPVDLHLGDYKDLSGQDRFDLIVSNPPFFKTGNTPADPGVAIARHEIHATMESLIAVSNKLLRGGGFLYLIYPASRLGELLHQLSLNKLMPYALKPVYPRPGKGAELVLVAAKKGHRGDLMVLSPFHVYAQGEVDSTETTWLYEKGEIRW